jgi:predicted nucleic acid-binding protein
MSAKIFIDTNILIYSIDKHSKLKQQKARQAIEPILKDGRAIISTQVIEEAYVVAVKKLRIPPLDAKRWTKLLSRFPVFQISYQTVMEAIDCSILEQLSFWDSLLIASAEEAGCAEIYTEDLSHGQVIRGVRVVNVLR